VRAPRTSILSIFGFYQMQKKNYYTLFKVALRQHRLSFYKHSEAKQKCC
jgi:hypothetical protein